MFEEMGRLLTDKDLLWLLGSLFSVAVLVGGILDNRGRDLLSWIVAVFFFAAFLTISAAQAMANAAISHIEVRVMAFITIHFLTYTIGLSVGWFTVLFAKWNYRRQRSKR